MHVINAIGEQELLKGNFCEVKLNGWLRAKPLLDSGSAINCLGIDFARAHRLKLKSAPPNVRVRSSNKENFKVFGTVELDVHVAEMIFPTTFYVLSSLCYPVIIGDEFLQANSVKIDFGRRSVTFCDLAVAPVICRRSIVAKACSRIIVPPESEILVNLKVPQSYNGQLLQLEIMPMVQKKKLFMARSIGYAKNGRVAANFLNVTAEPIAIYKHTPVAMVTVIDDSYNLHDYCVDKAKETYETAVITKEKFEEELAELKTIGLTLNLEKWDSEFQRNLVHMLYTNKDVFATSLNDLKGTNLLEFELEVDTSHPPIRMRPFRLSASAQLEAEKQVKELKEAKILEPAPGSPWAFPMIVVAKKALGAEPQWRVVVDFRSLNKITKNIRHWPIPTQQQLMDTIALRKPNIFTLLDLRSGYLQVPVSSTPAKGQIYSAKEMLCVQTPTETLRYRTMPFGLSGAPSEFQRLMNLCLEGYLFERCICFIDDLLVLSKKEDHIEHLESVIQRLKRANLRLHPRKCDVAMDRIHYLGVEVTPTHHGPSRSKVKAVEKWPAPSSTTQLKSFLGFCNFYRKYVKNYSKMSAIFGDLLRKDVPWKWTEEHQKAFEDLKGALCDATMLRHPDLNKIFRITTDASQGAISYILSQKDDNNRWYPVCFGGRSLKLAEKNYSATSIELLAILCGIREYRHYVCGKPFEVESDHYALQYLKSIKPQTGRLARWAMELSQYEFTVIHRPGKTLINADSLSRRPYDKLDESPVDFVDDDRNFVWTIDTPKSAVDNYIANIGSDKVVYEFDADDVKCVNAMLLRNQTQQQLQHQQQPSVAPVDIEGVENQTPDVINFETEDIAKLQSECDECKMIINYKLNNELPSDNKLARKLVMQADLFTMVDSVLYRLHRPRGKHRVDAVVRQLVVPRSLRERVMDGFHHFLCHIGLQKCWMSLSAVYWWENAYQDLYQRIKCCEICARTKRKYTRPAPITSLEPYPVLSSWHIDHVSIGTESNGFNYVLTMVDSASLWCELVATRGTSTPEVVNALFREVVARHGCPRRIVSDRAKSLTSDVISAFQKIFGIKRTLVSAYHAQSNVVAEGANAMILRSLRAICEENHSTWSDFLPSVALAHRASWNSSTQMSPYMAIYGRNMNLPINVQILPALSQDRNVGTYVRKLIPQLEIIQSQLAECQRNSKAKAKRAHDKHAAEPTFKINDLVMVFNPHVKPGYSYKLWHFFQGPSRIIDEKPGFVYKLQDVKTGKIAESYVHADRLKRFFGSVPTDRNANASQPNVNRPSVSPSPTRPTDLDENRPSNRPTNRPADGSVVDQPITPPSDANANQSGSSNVAGQGSQQGSPPQPQSLPPGHFPVKKILAHFRRQGKTYYKVVWQTSGRRQEISWEIEDNVPINLQDLYRQGFWKPKKRGRGTRQGAHA